MPNNNNGPGQGPFPQYLYVHEPLTKATEFDVYTTWQDSEEGDVFAVYQLTRVVRHTVTKTHDMEDYVYTTRTA